MVSNTKVSIRNLAPNIGIMPKLPIKFFMSGIHINLKERKKLKLFLQSFFNEEGKNLDSLNYIFSTDKYLLTLNQDFLSHDYLTDIITFNLSNDPRVISGEVYISVDRVRENATIHQVSLNNELHRVIFHGALHLCGYKDNSPKKMAEMRNAEDKMLRRYF